MNIYIKPQLEALLRKEDSMSGLINTLLAQHYDLWGKISSPVPPPSIKPRDIEEALEGLKENEDK